jgi:glycosyltransferase involved in cell wall biosynthesis
MPAILFLTAYPIEDASCRYRIHQFVTHLERAGYECTISSFATPTLFRALRKKGHLASKVRQTLSCTSRRLSTLAKLSEFDLVVIHREAFPFFAPLMENLALRLHPKVVFSFDDAIYCGHTEVSTLNHPLLYRAKHGRGYDGVIRRSFHVIAGNRTLAEHAAGLNPNVTVIPTVVDCQQFWCKPVARTRGPITIGWIGSQSTVSYLAMVEPVLREIARRNPGRVRFRMFGSPDYKLDVADCQSLPFVLDREAEDIRSLDIGLMPLPDTAWARGKCAFKAIQYMASGVPTVASPVGVTTDLIQHNDNGLIANSPIEWLHAIERLIYDLSLCQHIAVNARRTIEERYSLQVWGPRFVSLLDEIRQRGELPRPSSVAA